MTCLQKVTTVSFPLLFIFCPTFQFFCSQHLFQINCYLVHCAGCPPSFNKGSKGLPPPSPPATRLQKVTAVSFPLCFFSSRHSFFSHIIFTQLNCCSAGHAGRPPSVNKGNECPPPSSPPAICLTKATAVNFPLCSNHSQFFSWHLLSIKLWCSWVHRLPSLNQ